MWVCISCINIPDSHLLWSVSITSLILALSQCCDKFLVLCQHQCLIGYNGGWDGLVHHSIISWQFKIDLRILWRFSKCVYRILCWTPNFWASRCHGFLRSGRRGYISATTEQDGRGQSYSTLGLFPPHTFTSKSLLFNHWARREEGLWHYSDQGNTVEKFYYSKQRKFPRNRTGITLFKGSQNLAHIQWDCWVCYAYATFFSCFLLYMY